MGRSIRGGFPLSRKYIAALLLVALAFLVRLAADPVLGDRTPFLFFVLAILLAAGLYGVGPGTAATVASAIVGTLTFVQPGYDGFFNVTGFLIVAGAVLIFAHQMARGRRQRVHSDDARQISEERERRLIDVAQDYAIYELDRDGRILTWNKGAERLKGWRADEIVGQPYSVLHPPETRATGEPERELRLAAEIGQFEGEALRMRKDGSTFSARISLFPVRDMSGSVTGFVKITRDISEQGKADRAMIEARKRMEGIVESAMDAIITIDERQHVVLLNPAAERMFGVTAEEVIGKPVSQFIPERFRAGHDAHIRRFRKTGVTTRRMGALGAISGLRASGEEFPIEASISQVMIGGEQLSTVILRDITERKNGEEARALLSREVDHRAKNALAVAQALVGLTKADTVEEFSDAICGRIASLGRAHSLLSQSQWRGASLEKMIRDELTPYAAGDQLELDGPPLLASAEAVQPLSLLIHELATNAVKHGALSRRIGRLRIAWELGPNELLIKWTESGGPKVAPPEREGFGTRLLQQVTGRQLKADLKFDWRRLGLRVEVRLPADRFQHGEWRADRDTIDVFDLSEPDLSVPDERDQKAVLIVEDEELIALELASQLGHLGWAVVGPATSLAEANALLSSKLDAAVLDINLAGRSVYPIADELAKRGVPFIFCTGYEMADPEGRFPDVQVMRKPVNPKAVSASIGDLVRSRDAERVTVGSPPTALKHSAP